MATVWPYEDEATLAPFNVRPWSCVLGSIFEILAVLLEREFRGMETKLVQ
jgi:hypothetical protein